MKKIDTITCSDCDGYGNYEGGGKTIFTTCKKCNGTGLIDKPKTTYTATEFQAGIKNKTISVGPKKGDKAKSEMEAVINKFGACIKEHKFSDKRKFKFDFALLPHSNKIAIDLSCRKNSI